MQSGNEICPVDVILQNIYFLSKNSMKNVVWKLVPGPFLIFNESSVKKDSVEVSMLIWTNFDRLAIAYLI